MRGTQTWSEVNIAKLEAGEPIEGNLLTVTPNADGVAFGDRGEGAPLALVTLCQHCDEISAYNIEPDDLPERVRRV